MAADKSTLQIHVKQIPRANNLKNNAKNSSVIVIYRFLIQNSANYQTMAEI